MQRSGKATDELLQTFDLALEIRAQRAKLKDDLIDVERRLRILMRETFGGDHWCFGCPSPADDSLDSPRHHPIGVGTQLDRDWPLLQHDRQTLLAAWAEWKSRAVRND
jgi:hypothetical protein